jgi:hypothetical protein
MHVQANALRRLDPAAGPNPTPLHPPKPLRHNPLLYPRFKTEQQSETPCDRLRNPPTCESTCDASTAPAASVEAAASSAHAYRGQPAALVVLDRLRVEAPQRAPLRLAATPGAWRENSKDVAVRACTHEYPAHAGHCRPLPLVIGAGGGGGCQLAVREPPPGQLAQAVPQPPAPTEARATPGRRVQVGSCAAVGTRKYLAFVDY